MILSVQLIIAIAELCRVSINSNPYRSYPAADSSLQQRACQLKLVVCLRAKKPASIFKEGSIRYGAEELAQCLGES